MPDDTIYALATGRPPAAVAIIRVSGPRAHQAGAMLAGSLPEARQAAVRELRHADDLLDEALVLRFDGPASFTGEDSVEFQCHGGRAVVERVLVALATLEGLREAQPGEFTRRAFEHGRIDLTEAEGLADLIEAETESQRKAALALAEGGLRRQVENWRTRILALSARAEAAIDYAEDGDVGPDPTLGVDAATLADELAEWLSRPRIEPLKDGVRVVIAGPPNAGKSSLLNALAATDRAIVTPIPGTTRDHIDVPMSIDGIPVVLTDTAGLRPSQDPVEQIGVARARTLAEGSDVLLWLGDPQAAPVHSALIKVHPRADLEERKVVPHDSFATSVVSMSGVPEILREIGRQARTLLPTDGTVALNKRQAAQLFDAQDALARATTAKTLELQAEDFRAARAAFDRITGRAGTEDLMDTIFGRFCLGK